MSLFLDSSEILVGLQETQQKDDAVIRALSCFYVQSDPKPKSETQFSNEKKNMVGGSERVGAFCFEDSCESSESSSIGAAESYVTDDLDDGSIDAEVQSKLQSPLGSMVSLEESLPIKRGLSNFFSGKSKSFTSLLEASTVKELAKPENPFNKRRRILLACKRGSSYCNLLGPDFALEEAEEEEGGENRDICPANLPIPGRRKHKSFADLQQYGS